MSDSHTALEQLKHSCTDHNPDTTAALVVAEETRTKPGLIIEDIRRKLTDHKNVFILTPHWMVARQTVEHIRFPFSGMSPDEIKPYRTTGILTTADGDYLLSLDDCPELTVTPDGRARLSLSDGRDDIYLDDSDALADAPVPRASPNEDETQWRIYDAADNVVETHSDRADWQEKYQPIWEYADPIGPEVWEQIRIFYAESGELLGFDSDVSPPAGERAHRLNDSVSTFYETFTIARKGEAIPLREFHCCWAACMDLAESELQSSLSWVSQALPQAATVQRGPTTDGYQLTLADRTWRYPLEVPKDTQD